jgi:hypothetical protein
LQRIEYLIDRFPVAYEWGGGWQCVCADFAASKACRHTREAAGRRAAQSQIARHIGNGRSELDRRSEPAAPAIHRRISDRLEPTARIFS